MILFAECLDFQVCCLLHEFKFSTSDEGPKTSLKVMRRVQMEGWTPYVLNSCFPITLKSSSPVSSSSSFSLPGTHPQIEVFSFLPFFSNVNWLEIAGKGGDNFKWERTQTKTHDDKERKQTVIKEQAGESLLGNETLLNPDCGGGYTDLYMC